MKMSHCDFCNKEFDPHTLIFVPPDEHLCEDCYNWIYQPPTEDEEDEEDEYE